MKNSILVALKDSVNSRKILDYLIQMPIRRDEVHITLVHVFKHPPGSEEFMGEQFSKEEPPRLQAVLQNGKEKLIKNGFSPDQIRIKLVTEPHPTTAQGIISFFNKENFDMVMIARKRKSKAEEFVLGDVSVKLVRALEGASVLVVKPK